MRGYHRLTEGDRHQVYALHKAGLRQSAIAEQIGVQSRRIAWLVHGSFKFPAPVFWMRCGLGLELGLGLKR